jgi:hypothetical protein
MPPKYREAAKPPPLPILKRKTLLKSEAFPKNVIVRAQERGWMTEELMLKRQKIAFYKSTVNACP